MKNVIPSSKKEFDTNVCNLLPNSNTTKKPHNSQCLYASHWRLKKWAGKIIPILPAE
jgi:hypothetical protein